MGPFVWLNERINVEANEHFHIKSQVHCLLTQLGGSQPSPWGQLGRTLTAMHQGGCDEVLEGILGIPHPGNPSIQRDIPDREEGGKTKGPYPDPQKLQPECKTGLLDLL